MAIIALRATTGYPDTPTPRRPGGGLPALRGGESSRSPRRVPRYRDPVRIGLRLRRVLPASGMACLVLAVPGRPTAARFLDAGASARRALSSFPRHGAAAACRHDGARDGFEVGRRRDCPASKDTAPPSRKAALVGRILSMSKVEVTTKRRDRQSCRRLVDDPRRWADGDGHGSGTDSERRRSRIPRGSSWSLGVTNALPVRPRARLGEYGVSPARGSARPPGIDRLDQTYAVFPTRRAVAASPTSSGLTWPPLRFDYRGYALLPRPGCPRPSCGSRGPSKHRKSGSERPASPKTAARASADPIRIEYCQDTKS